MKSSEPHWYEELKKPPSDRNMFTPEMEKQVLRHLTIQGKRQKPFISFGLFAAVCAAVLATVIVLSSSGKLPAVSKLASMAGISLKTSTSKDWQPHSFYKDGPNLLLEAYPGGDFKAGQRAGSWWNIHEPYEELQYSTIKITATHRQSGIVVDELPETPVDKSMIYDDFVRVSSDFALPIPGTWRFDVWIDGQKLGDTVFEVSDSDWQVSPRFEYEKSKLRGNQGRSGYVSSGFIAGSGNKFLWHLWDTKELSGQLLVKAVKKDTSRVLTILDTKLSGSQKHQSVPSTMELPETGLWRLLIYVDGTFFDSMVVKAEATWTDEQD